MGYLFSVKNNQVYCNQEAIGNTKNPSYFGVNNFIEIGPGKVLTGMVKRTLKNVNCFSINSIADIKNLINEYLSDLQIWPDKDERYLEKARFGFPARQDLASWDAFHRAETWDEKVQIKFKDARSKRMAKRIIFDNAPEVLDDNAYNCLLYTSPSPRDS